MSSLVLHPRNLHADEKDTDGLVISSFSEVALVEEQ